MGALRQLTTLQEGRPQRRRHVHGRLPSAGGGAGGWALLVAQAAAAAAEGQAEPLQVSRRQKGSPRRRRQQRAAPQQGQQQQEEQGAQGRGKGQEGRRQERSVSFGTVPSKPLPSERELFARALTPAVPRVRRAAEPAPGGGGEQAGPSTSVLNYTYFDSARRDTVIPIAPKKPKLGAAEVMKMDQQAQPK